MKLVFYRLKMDPCLAIKWHGAGGAVPGAKRVASEVSCRMWLLSGYAVAVDAIVVVAAAARGRKAIMTLSIQKYSCHGIHNERLWSSRVFSR